MSIKEKVAIVLTIFIVIAFGFILKGRAAQTVTVVSNLDALASKATSSRNTFLNIDQSQLAGRKIGQGGNKAIYYKGAMCMYHVQSTSWIHGDSNYLIYHVLDFDFEDGKVILRNNRIKSK